MENLPEIVINRRENRAQMFGGGRTEFGPLGNKKNTTMTMEKSESASSFLP